MFIKLTKEKIVVGAILLFLCCFPFIHNTYLGRDTLSNTAIEETKDKNTEKTKENQEKPVIEDVVKPTLYDTYSPDEIELLFGVVEAETIGCEFDVKCNVVSVIFNRIEDTRFKQNTLKDVLLAPNQFSVVKSGAYKTVEVTYDTVDACEYVFEYGDTAADSVFFEGMKSNVHGSYATYTFNDGKHKFYK